MILHIDMDAFFASIEQAINPKLKGRPLIVGSRANKLYTVVCTASYEAKAYGIDSGMPSKEAFKICPDLCFVPAQQSCYIWTSEQIFQLLKGFGYEVAYASIDEFQLDILDNPEPRNLAQSIQKMIQENFKITASIGIAKNYLLAKLASRINKPKGIAIITEENLEFILAQIPVNKLCGIGPKTAPFFENLGIETCLDLYRKEAWFLEQILGKNGLNLYLSLHSNERLAPQETEEKPKSLGHSYTFSRASQNTGFIQGWIRLLSEMVGRRLREQNLAARTIHLWLNGPEIGNFGQQKTYKEPTSDGYEIYQKTCQIWAKNSKKWPKVRAMGVSCSNLSRQNNLSLLKEVKRREDLVKAVDRINSRLGDWTIYPAAATMAKNQP
ncbi:MAG: hypothetical protein DRP74_07665 [Candidatus Omnitrophota bacterium]|nr:MAG: hypothetical protein DRP74_07665 [Candidatus Omnitrophota bacterium]